MKEIIYLAKRSHTLGIWGYKKETGWVWYERSWWMSKEIARWFVAFAVTADPQGFDPNLGI